jgi:hypothetical protein
MACKLARSMRPRAATTVVVALLACSIASAQTDTAPSEPSAEPDPNGPAASEPAPSEPAPSEPAPNEPAPGTAAPNEAAPSDPAAGGAVPAAPSEPAASGGAPADFPKALTPQQRAPENLQGWLRERNRRHPALAERPPLVPPPAPPAPESDVPERAVDGYRRRLQSFDEGGVTVLSNRHAAPPPLARVQTVAAVVAPAPRPDPGEQDREESSFTETRSLRAKPPKARRLPSEHGLGWTVFALPVAAIALTLLWLRKRRMSD